MPVYWGVPPPKVTRYEVLLLAAVIALLMGS
jgi:hypothetical protein